MAATEYKEFQFLYLNVLPLRSDILFHILQTKGLDTAFVPLK
jgi:hypothetical protein